MTDEDFEYDMFSCDEDVYYWENRGWYHLYGDYKLYLDYWAPKIEQFVNNHGGQGYSFEVVAQ